MNKTHGFGKHYNVCLSEIMSLHLGVVFGYNTWTFREIF